MSARNPVTKALSVVLSGGALGASIALALGYAAATAKPPAEAQAAPQQSVSNRLQAIRLGVSALSQSAELDSQSGSAQPPRSDVPLVPTWWGNGGWGRWRYGWGNGWHNYWHNG